MKSQSKSRLPIFHKTTAIFVSTFFMLFNVFEYATPVYAARPQSVYEEAALKASDAQQPDYADAKSLGNDRDRVKELMRKYSEEGGEEHLDNLMAVVARRGGVEVVTREGEERDTLNKMVNSLYSWEGEPLRVRVRQGNGGPLERVSVDSRIGQITAVGNSHIYLWDEFNGERSGPYGGNIVSYGRYPRNDFVSFTPEGSHILFNHDRAACMMPFSRELGNRPRDIDNMSFASRKSPFSPDGSLLMTRTRGNFEKVNVLDWATMKQLYEIKLGITELEDENFDGYEIHQIMMSPDNKRIVIMADLMGNEGFGDRFSLNRTYLEVWDTEKMERIPGFFVELDSNSGFFRADLTSNGKELITVQTGGLVRVWDINTGNEIRNFRIDLESVAYFNEGFSVAITPNGEQIVTNHRNGIAVWDIRTGAKIQQYLPTPSSNLPPDSPILVEGGLIHDIKITFNGRKIITVGMDGTMRTLYANINPAFTEYEQGLFPNEVFPERVSGESLGTESEVGAKSLGKRVAVDLEKVISRLIDLPGDRSLIESVIWLAQKSTHFQRVRDLFLEILKREDLSNSTRQNLFYGLRLLNAYESHGYEFRGSNVKPKISIRTRPIWVEHLAFSPDGRFFVAVLENSEISFSSVELRDAETGDFIQELVSYRGSINSLDFSPDGKLLALGLENSTITLIDFQTRQPIRVLQTSDVLNGEYPIASIAFSPDGNQLVAGMIGPNSLLSWDLKENGDPERFNVSLRNVNSIIFKPTGSEVVVGMGDGFGGIGGIQIVDISSGDVSDFVIESSHQIFELAIDSQGKFLVRSEGGRIKIFDMHLGNEVASPYGGLAYGLMFSPDGNMLVDSSYQVWDITTGIRIATLENEFSDRMGRAVAISPDGRKVIVAAQKHGLIYLWEALRKGENYYQALTKVKGWKEKDVDDLEKAVKALDSDLLQSWKERYKKTTFLESISNTREVGRLRDELGKEIRETIPILNKLHTTRKNSHRIITFIVFDIAAAQDKLPKVAEPPKEYVLFDDDSEIVGQSLGTDDRLRTEAKRLQQEEVPRMSQRWAEYYEKLGRFYQGKKANSNAWAAYTQSLEIWRYLGNTEKVERIDKRIGDIFLHGGQPISFVQEIPEEWATDIIIREDRIYFIYENYILMRTGTEDVREIFPASWVASVLISRDRTQIFIGHGYLGEQIDVWVIELSNGTGRESTREEMEDAVAKQLGAEDEADAKSLGRTGDQDLGVMEHRLKAEADNFGLRKTMIGAYTQKGNFNRAFELIEAGWRFPTRPDDYETTVRDVIGDVRKQEGGRERIGRYEEAVKAIVGALFLASGIPIEEMDREQNPRLEIDEDTLGVTLRLNGTQVEDVNGLRDLINLERLYLAATPVQDVSGLGALVNLRRLNLNHTLVQNVSGLSALVKLEVLYLSFTPVEDVSSLDELVRNGLRIYGVEAASLGDPREGDVLGKLREVHEYLRAGRARLAEAGVVLRELKDEEVIAEELKDYLQKVMLELAEGREEEIENALYLTDEVMLDWSREGQEGVMEEIEVLTGNERVRAWVKRYREGVRAQLLGLNVEPRIDETHYGVLGHMVVFYSRGDINSESLNALKGLKYLRYLSLSRTQVKDIRALKDLRELEVVSLRGTPITNDDPIVKQLRERGVEVITDASLGAEDEVGAQSLGGEEIVRELSIILGADRISGMLRKNSKSFNVAINLLSQPNSLVNFTRVFTILRDSPIGRERLQDAFEQSPFSLVYSLVLLASLETDQFEEFFNYIGKDGTVDLNKLLEEKKQKLFFKNWGIPTLNATRGMIHQMKIQPKNTVIQFLMDVEGAVARQYFPGFRVQGLGDLDGNLEIVFMPTSFERSDLGDNNVLITSLKPFKYAIPKQVHSQESENEIEALRRTMKIVPGRKIIVAASPNKDDVKTILKSYEEAWREVPLNQRPLLILGLRYVGIKEWQQQLRDSVKIEGFRIADRNEEDQAKTFNGLAGNIPFGDLDIVVLNTQGELADLMKTADLVLVGRDRNILEPVSLSIPTLYFQGDWPNNQRVLDFMMKHNAVQPIDRDHLKDQMKKILNDKDGIRDQVNDNVTRAIKLFEQDFFEVAKLHLAITIAAGVLKGDSKINFNKKQLAEADANSLGTEIDISVLGNLEEPVNVFMDGREINALSLGQKEEMFKLAGMNPKKLTIVVANALGYEKPPELDLPNIIFTPQSEVEASRTVRRAEHNLHMSIGVDPAKEFTLIRDNKFRYPDDESGFLAVALLYTQSKNQMAFSMKYGLKRINGFFSSVGQALMSLVQEYETGLVIGRAA